MSRSRRIDLVQKDHPGLSVVLQSSLLGLSRSAVYYQGKGQTAYNLELMRLIDEQFLDTPYYGSRQMTRWLRRQGHRVNRKRIGRLMGLMGLSVIYQKPNTSRPHPDHKVYPYLLRNVEVTRPNQVWSTDITYIPMRRGFLYLVAIMDWSTRAVLSWRLSNTMDSDFCVQALEEALARHGRPEIFNTDQGSQFTSFAFTNVLKGHGVKISMDGKGRCLDNVFIERLWRSLKYECVYLKEFETGLVARQEIGDWIRKYNWERPHSSLPDDMTPMEVYNERMAA